MTTTTTAWKVGDWCLWEFQLAQIEKMEDDRIVNVSTGIINCGSNSHNDRCVPLTKTNLQISQSYESWKTKLHAEGNAGLNFPDISRWMIQHWRETIDLQDTPDVVQERYTELRKFCMSILDRSDIDSGYGFQLYRPRR